jgi:proteasome component ECM29
MFQGNNSDKLLPEERTSPANIVLRCKIMQQLSRSTLAANNFPNTLQVIFESVYGKETTMKLKQLAMTFVQWVFRQSSDQQITAMGPVILSGLLKLLETLKTEPQGTGRLEHTK